MTQTNPLWYGITGFAIPKIYETSFTPQQKQVWKQQLPIHHGAIGILAFIGGILTNNPKLALFGAGLALDDWKDRKDWFRFNNQDVVF